MAIHDVAAAGPQDGADISESAISGAVYANNFSPVPSPTTATGLRTEQLRRRSLGVRPQARIAEDFLVATRYRRGSPAASLSMAHYYTDSGQLMLSLQGKAEVFGWERVGLPSGPRLKSNLGTVIAERRSCRKFTGDPVGLGYIATVLRAAAGVTSYARVSLHSGGETFIQLRATASGGGVYPVTLYFAANQVTGLPRAIYSYDASGDHLWRVGDAAELDRLLASFAAPEDIISLDRAAAVMLVVGEPWKCMRKYGDRGMRYVFLEAGGIAHAVHLAAVGLGIGGVECAGYYDDEANEALGFDGLFEAVLHAIILGHPGEETTTVGG
jgi:SagB-type dehydrogenase family enzyme